MWDLTVLTLNKGMCTLYVGTRVRGDQLYLIVEKGEVTVREILQERWSKPDVEGQQEFSNKWHMTEVVVGAGSGLELW